MLNIHDPEHPVVLFIPEAGLYPFLRGLAVLGDAVRKQGGRVLVTRCTGQMLRTPMMAKKRLPVVISEEARKMIYQGVERLLNWVQKKYHFSFIELSELVDEPLMKEIEALVDERTGLLEDIVYQGFPVGKIAQYDFILETKFPYLATLPEAQQALYAVYIKNTALTIEITNRICKKYTPSLFLTFNEYAQCQAVRYSAEQHGVRRMAMTYPTHFNTDASRFSIWKSTCEFWRYVHCQNWHTEKETPISPRAVEVCWQDTVFRMFQSGSHIFSAQKHDEPGQIFEKLKLNLRKKTIVVYTSSQDERTSVEVAMRIWGEDNHIKDAFANHIEWLTFLRAYAAERDDIQIVVRIHPREGSRGQGFDSQHLLDLKRLFAEDSANFYLIWPDDPISSYDLMELADVCLVAWSLMGQEAARVGIPVLVWTGNMFYPDDDFLQVATSPEEYRQKLDTIISMKYGWKQLLKAFRFYHWRIFLLSLDLSETVPTDYADDTVWPEAPASKVQVINDILSGKQDLITYNIQQWKEGLTADSARLEAEAMRRGIRLFLDCIYYPPRVDKKTWVFRSSWERLNRKVRRAWYILVGHRLPKAQATPSLFNDYVLEYTEDVSLLTEFQRRTAADHSLRAFVTDGMDVMFVHEGRVVRRMSPMIARLARLHG